MDGFKRRLNESVQFKLSFMLSLAILTVAIVAGMFSFMSAFDEAHELQDDVLRQISVLMGRQPLPPGLHASDDRLNESDEESRVIVQRLGDNGSDQLLSLPARLMDGLHTLDVGGESYRLLIRTTVAGEQIAVAQKSSFRDAIALDSALRTTVPFLVLVPILLLIVADLIRKMFRPITVLSKEIDRRAEQELHAIDAQHLPTEVRPFAVAINRLLGRVDQSMQSQRRFVADAAHELRSPMAALSLQAERLAEVDMPDQARERLQRLREGIGRGRNLLDQLLTLARVQSATDKSKSLLSVQHIYRRALEDLMPLAESKRLDIGVDGEQDAEVWANELDMTTMVRNVIDNAIRYTPEGGRIDLSVSVNEGRVILCIRDTGPGIPPEARERVFDPFYRTLGSNQIGSGLGLSIVQVVADQMGANIELSSTGDADSSGLCIRIGVPSNDEKEHIRQRLSHRTDKRFESA